MSDREDCLAVFVSVHHALRAEKLLKEADISVQMLPVPREISTSCGLAARFSCRERGRVVELLSRHQVETAGFYRISGQGRSCRYAEIPPGAGEEGAFGRPSKGGSG